MFWAIKKSAVAWFKKILFKTKSLWQIGLKHQNIQIFMCLSNEQYNMSYILLRYQLNQWKRLKRNQIEIKPAMKSFIKKPYQIGFH